MNATEQLRDNLMVEYQSEMCVLNAARRLREQLVDRYACDLSLEIADDVIQDSINRLDEINEELTPLQSALGVSWPVML